MRKLYILGTGAVGRDMVIILEDFPEYNKSWEIAGFLHHGPSDLDQYPCAYRIIGDWENFNFAPDDMVLIGVADPAWKRRLYQHLSGRVEFMTAVHPSVWVSKFVEIGAGSLICQNSVIGTNTVIGECTTITVGSTVGHDCRIGAFSSLMTHVDLGGGVEIGENVFIGTKATIVPRKRIGDNCKIAAGSVVMRHVKEGRTMFGNPACELFE